MIHGHTGSIGCLAMGDPASEELFVLAYDTKLQNIDILLLPCDFRNKPQPKVKGPAWIPELYSELEKAIAKYPLPP